MPSTTEPWWKLALRWIAVLPATVVAYIFATWAYFFGLGWAVPTLSREIRYADAFEGHYVMGPLLVFGWFFIATAAATMAGMKTAPSHRIVVAVVLAGCGKTLFRTF